MSKMQIERDHYDINTIPRDESLFCCASGKIGVRGCFEEGAPEGVTSTRGAYINGFSETSKISYNEKLYGFPTEKQTIVCLPDAQTIEFLADGEKICCWSEKASDFYYALDMEKGIVKRSFVYDTGKGKLDLKFERLAGFKRPGIFAISVLVRSIDYKGKLSVRSLLNGDVKNHRDLFDPRLSSGDGQMIKINSTQNIDFTNKSNDLTIQEIEVETFNSHRKAKVFTAQRLLKKDAMQEISFVYDKTDKCLSAVSEVEFEPGTEVILYKYCYYQEIPDDTDGAAAVAEAYEAGFDKLKDEQAECLKEFWDDARVLINGDNIKQENMDFCLYGMFSSAGRDGKTSIAAKGLTGEGYEGHYFWDGEIYIFPFFLMTKPEIAKALLLFRYGKLDSAREHAGSMGHKKGALYPWRTITGSECSSHYPSGSAQYHINGDIARAFIQYFNASKDHSILPEICEVLLETARLWMDVGYYSEGRFRIDCVTGPDEYTCMVNNNYYTNACAAFNLVNAARLIRILKGTDKYDAFAKKTKVSESELEEFEEAAANMFYPFDEKLGIIGQDDSFLSKKKLDFKNLPKEDFPLLLHYHPLFLNRHQVCKQADAVLAEYLFCELDPLTSMRTYEYYEEVTTHDSSLSKCIFGIMAAKLGDLDKALDYFKETLTTDLDDRAGNTKDGLHTANMGGSYRMVVGGFAGLEIGADGISMFPVIPEKITSYSFPITYQGRKILVKVNADGVSLKVSGCASRMPAPIEIKVYNEKITLGETEVFIPRKAKAVIFDLDGVIADSAVLHYQAWQRLADELGIAFDREKNENFKGVSRAACLKMLLEWGNIKVPEERFEELLVIKNDYYKELLKTLTPDDVLPGVMECIRKLKEKNIPISIFSVSKNTDEILRRLGLSETFDAVVTGYDITKSKPHYEGYLKAAGRMNTDPRLCVMVEDSVAGIEGAKKLSMKTLAIMKENKANADLCIPSTDRLDEIMKLL